MTRYDRVIPPGGTGKVTLTVDTSTVIGEFEKRAVVWSNDLERRSVALYLKGEVIPYIKMEPGGFVSLNGALGRVPKGYIEIINNHESPLKITGIDNELPDNIKWRLKEIKEGFAYGLEIEDISDKAGSYTAHLTIKTDNPQKQTLIVVVQGAIYD